MTERIYYTDPQCRAFEAIVTRAFLHDGRPAVILDRTAFYPTSGGQPFDTGRLIVNGAPSPVAVIDTIDLDDDIVHVLEAMLPERAAVRGEIDWARRVDHMQQHTGQHVLSAAFDRLLGNPTLSFHMGAASATIDLAREATAAAIEQAVDEANRIVWEDRPVAIRFVSREQAAALPLRKQPEREGTLRLIDIAGSDLSACGGTHVPRTGMVGVIVVLGDERFRGGTRVTFACGGRAVDAWRSYRDAVAGSVRTLSVLPQELPGAVERAQADLKNLRKTVGRLQLSLASQEASRMLRDASDAGGTRVIVEALDGWDAQGLKAIASALVEHGRVAAALFSGSPALAVIARSPDAPGDARVVLRGLIQQFGGRGGGKADMAQGGGLTGTTADVLDAARERLSAARA